MMKAAVALLLVFTFVLSPFSLAERKFVYENNKKEMPFGISFLFILLKYIELENDWCYNYL